MEFRRAGRDDIAGLAEMRLLYLEDDFGMLSREECDAIAASLPVYFDKHLRHDLSVFVCEDNGALVSCVFLLTVEKPASPAFPTGRIGILLNVYTRPHYRRRGIAETLLRMTLDDARNQQLSHVELKATSMGEPLYLKLGFKHDDFRHTPMRYDFAAL